MTAQRKKARTEAKVTKDLAQTYALLNDLWALTHTKINGFYTERDVRAHLVALHKRYGYPITSSIAPVAAAVSDRQQRAK